MSGLSRFLGEHQHVTPASMTDCVHGQFCYSLLRINIGIGSVDVVPTALASPLSLVGTQLFAKPLLVLMIRTLPSTSPISLLPACLSSLKPQMSNRCKTFLCCSLHAFDCCAPRHLHSIISLSCSAATVPRRALSGRAWLARLA